MARFGRNRSVNKVCDSLESFPLFAQLIRMERKHRILSENLSRSCHLYRDNRFHTNLIIILSSFCYQIERNPNYMSVSFYTFTIITNKYVTTIVLTIN